MAKIKTLFCCQHCGAQAAKWLGRCPECGQWNTYVEEQPLAEAKRTPILPNDSVAEPIAISKIQIQDGKHIPTGIEELDRVLGGGYVPGCLALIGGDPGIGKSTIVTQMLAKLAEQKKNILYVSAEESAAQIKLRCERMKITSDKFFVLTENCLERIIEHARRQKPDVLVIDSIQTVYTNDVQSAPGTVSQVRECAAKLLTLAKGATIATFLIGHVTKDGSIAGPKVLEHMVDTTLYFEGERGHPYRILRTIKNRFGSTNEIGVFEMTSDGLIEVKNPSNIFLAERAENASGSSIVPILEGSRPMLLEIQALVSSSGLANPRRTALGIETARLSILVAVLEKVMGIQLYDQDIFLNVAGGMKITEPASDLAVLTAIHSSFRNQPLNHHLVLIGEVGLTGEIRSVFGVETRLKEAQKLGFKYAIIPASSQKISLPKGIEVMTARNIKESLSLLPDKSSGPF